MTHANKPVVLGIDEDRSAQAEVARTFNEQGVFYRFVTERRKVPGGVKQLKPDVVMLFGELESDFVIQVLDTLSHDAAGAQVAVVVVARDTSDAVFAQGMRTGVVSMLQAPFSAAHVGVVRALWEELGSRSGTTTGASDAATLGRFVEHLRRTRRTGLLQTNPRLPDEGRAAFAYGRLERASFLGALGADALKAMLHQPQARWSFTELSGTRGEGAGVVIEVGDVVTGETPLAEVLVGEPHEDDEPLAFEVSAPTPPGVEAPSAEPGAVPQLLLVDDDPAILKMFSTLFTRHGFAVSTAPDGSAGAELALQRHFDVVVADLNMPHLDGWGMLRVLRDDFRTRELPVAFLSAHDDYRESLRALDAGAQAYLSKGTRLDAIVTQAVKLLEPRRAVLRQLDEGQTAALPIHTVGPQWLLRQLALRRATGVVTARDGWAAYQLALENGVCFHASAVAGKYTAERERAFNAFVASRAAEGAFLPGLTELPRNLFLSTEVMLERACVALNESEQRMRDSLMLEASKIDVNAELYAVYAHVGPRQWLEPARLICEERVPPREIIARLELSPVDIEECMKDLIRRGVVTLRRG